MEDHESVASSPVTDFLLVCFDACSQSPAGLPCGVSINLLDVVTAISEKSPAIVTVKIRAVATMTTPWTGEREAIPEIAPEKPS